VLAGLSLSKSLVSEGVSTVITMSIGEVLFHALRDSYIEILQTRGDTVSEVIEALERGELEHISAPTRESGEIAAREKIREMDTRPGDR